ncbi:hypothetical protein CANARDRAFT_8754 [[Candida] arabinofermentans NRRL YB-2248]|uniref:F-box domain-containing protein n=1 Tax=[Candida] arabinofermentans NRRL YB-2248 TaxID=983967 RepID=A0A1E4SY41_9ASCO|nr:hypothetical protein CANARDRAFT_8754 [[Candida] arabinofermentans NRRL YB-2248]
MTIDQTVPNLTSLPPHIIATHILRHLPTTSIITLINTVPVLYRYFRHDNRLFYKLYKSYFTDRCSQSLKFHDFFDWYLTFKRRCFARLVTWGSGSLGYSYKDPFVIRNQLGGYSDDCEPDVGTCTGNGNESTGSCYVTGSDSIAISSGGKPIYVERIGKGFVVVDYQVVGWSGDRLTFLGESGDAYVTFKSFEADDDNESYLDNGNTNNEKNHDNVSCRDGYLLQLFTGGVKLRKLIGAAFATFILALDESNSLWGFNTKHAATEYQSKYIPGMLLNLLVEFKQGEGLSPVDMNKVDMIQMSQDYVAFRYHLDKTIDYPNGRYEYHDRYLVMTFDLKKQDHPDELKCEIVQDIHQDIEHISISGNTLFYTRSENGSIWLASLDSNKRKQYDELHQVGLRYSYPYSSCGKTTVTLVPQIGKKSNEYGNKYQNILNHRQISTPSMTVGFARGYSHFLCFTNTGELYSWGEDQLRMGCLGLGSGELNNLVENPTLIEIDGYCLGVECGVWLSCAIIC